MKLSEAIRLGSMLGPQEFGPGLKHGRCALQGAVAAMGEPVTLHVLPMMRKYWRWMVEGNSEAVACPECVKVSGVFGVLIHLNDHHKWTREQIADWVTTLEPQDIQNEQTDGGAGTHPTELSRSDEVQNIGV